MDSTPSHRLYVITNRPVNKEQAHMYVKLNELVVHQKQTKNYCLINPPKPMSAAFSSGPRTLCCCLVPGFSGLDFQVNCGLYDRAEKVVSARELQ